MMAFHAGGSDLPFKKNSRTGALKLRIRDGNRGHESTRVGMLRVLKDILDRAVFNDATQIHDRDVIGDLAHNGEVVSDKEVAQAEFVTEILEQVDHASLDGHVQCRDGFIEHEKLGFGDERSAISGSSPTRSRSS